jgi:hypothetical protein
MLRVMHAIGRQKSMAKQSILFVEADIRDLAVKLINSIMISFD